MGGFPALPIADPRHIAGEEIESLNASQIKSGTISAQKIVLSDNVNSILKSGNYVAGSAGWQILGDGDAEFNDVTVRGTIFATSGELGDLDVTGDIEVGAGGTIQLNGGSVQTSTGNVYVLLDGGVSDAVRFVRTTLVGHLTSLSGGDMELKAFHSLNSYLRLESNQMRVFLDDVVNLQVGPVGVRVRDGAVSLPSMSFLNDTDTGVYLAATADLRVTVGGSDKARFTANQVIFPEADNSTTGSAANVHVATGGRLLRSTSSVRYKTDLAPWDRRHSILDVTPTLFRSVADNDAPDTQRLGLIAEDVAEHFPFAAIADADGRPDAIDWNSVVAGLIAEVQALRKELAHASH